MLPILLLGSTAIFFPLGFYFLTLYWLNRRRHPVMVFGVWDFALALLGVSGILLFLGPSTLTGFTYQWRELWLQLHYRSLKHLQDQWGSHWMWFWYLYFALVALACGVLLWTRRSVTSVYNVDAETVRQALAVAIKEFDLDAVTSANCIYIGSLGEAEDTPSPEPVYASAISRFLWSGDSRAEAGYEIGAAKKNGFSKTRQKASGTAIIRLEPFRRMRHMTLRWIQDQGNMRPEIETALAAAFREISAVENPASNYFLYAAAVIFVGLFLFTTSIQFIIMTARAF